MPPNSYEILFFSLYIGCAPGAFQCLVPADKVCLSEAEMCDGQSDCADGADELNCGKHITLYFSMCFKLIHCVQLLLSM